METKYKYRVGQRVVLDPTRSAIKKSLYDESYIDLPGVVLGVYSEDSIPKFFQNELDLVYRVDFSESYVGRVEGLVHTQWVSEEDMSPYLEPCKLKNKI